MELVFQSMLPVWGAAALAEERCRAEEGSPLLDDLAASGFNNHHDIAQSSGGNLGIVVAQVTAAGSGDPDLRGVGGGGTLGYMDVDRLQGVIFI